MEAVDFVVSMFEAGSTWNGQSGIIGYLQPVHGLKIAVQTGTTQEEEVSEAQKSSARPTASRTSRSCPASCRPM